MYLCVIVLLGLIDQPIKMIPIENYPLYNLVVGDTLNISCVIESTCGYNNVVEFINEQGVTIQSFMRNEDGAFNWNPIVDRNLSGTYHCFAQNPLGTAFQTFMITGKCNTFVGDHFCTCKSVSRYTSTK